MAPDSADGLNYYLLVEKTRKQDLARIRHWSNLNLAFEKDAIWIKDFNYSQINSLEVKSMPFKTVFEYHNSKLHLIGSLLPERNVPNVLWTSISRALPVKLPELNHNYFGFDHKLQVKIVATELEQPAEAMVVELRDLKQYIATAPAIRLNCLHWAILNNDKALLLGTPLLPISAEAYWFAGRSIIPAGYDLEFPMLRKDIEELIDAETNSLILWAIDNTYAIIDRDCFQPLALSSFRKSAIEHRLDIV